MREITYAATTRCLAIAASALVSLVVVLPMGRAAPARDIGYPATGAIDSADSVRYRAKIGNASPVLAFGAMLRNDVAWISEILQGNDVALVAREAEALRPINQSAQQLPIFR